MKSSRQQATKYILNVLCCLLFLWTNYYKFCLCDGMSCKCYLIAIILF